MAKRRRTRRKNAVPMVLTGLLITVLLVIAVGVVLFALSWVRGMFATPGVAPGLPSSTGPSEHVHYKFGQVLPAWTGEDRVTVLLLGVDEREQESGPWRTDTIMLLTLDPVTKQAGVLSIPRDLWVPIPGHNEGRINTAHFVGDLYGHPGGGPALAEETVEYNLGVPIDYFVRVNFHGFVTLVDQIGGIDVYVEKTIHDPTYPDYHYGYDPLHIEAGWHHFDGEMALKYARTRHGTSDFDRARRQQQVMLAIQEKVTSVDMLPDLARNASQIYQTVETSIHTNLALDQMLALANLSTEVDRSQIRFGVIDSTCTQQWVTPDGAQVLVPIREEMRKVRDYVFGVEQATPAPDQSQAQPTANVPTPTPEVATVAVLNGTTRAGLAGATSDYLKAHAIHIIDVGNAERQDHATSLVIMNHDTPRTASKIADLLSIPATAVVKGADPDAAYDLVVILGADYTGPPEN
jgi:LCP family protein required for cell wall assembly